MSAVTSRYERPADHGESTLAPRLQRGDGAAEIGFVQRAGSTELAHLYQRTPCRVLFPSPEPGDLTLAALLTTSGGLTGGDRLRLAVHADAGARAVVTTGAAEKIYRASGGDVTVQVNLDVASDGWLEWLPQETILFDGARLVRRIGVQLAADARLLAAEMLVFGRLARGERFRHGLLHEAWRVRVGERLVWADALRLEGDIERMLDAPAGFGGASAIATAILVAPDAERHLPRARAFAETCAAQASATMVNGVLLMRLLAERAELVRATVAEYVAAVRHAAAGLPAAMPRLWST
jgi:urease accessory protein